jgi:hypothetical protein
MTDAVVLEGGMAYLPSSRELRSSQRFAQPRSRLLCTLWLPLAGPTALMVAVSHCEAQKETELS